MSNNKSKQLQAVRGMNDLLPQESHLWQVVERTCIDVLEKRGYSEIRVPIVEQTQLFARSIGAETDIVAKEMYTFEDRNGDSLTLRPEGTASSARAGIEHSLFYNQTQRLWYYGPMFRHERPQKGRYRQFYQLGAEAYGWTSVDIEAELIGAVRDMFEALGLKQTKLEINSLGDPQSRAEFRTRLTEYLSAYKNDLDEDSQRRLESNPLRILDSKHEKTREILLAAPSLADCLGDESRSRFEQLKAYLQALDIDYTVNTKLVRGLDYYNDTVFEWVNADFGAQSTVCAGGRYDGLVEQIGGSSTPGFGFAMGMERLIQILQEQNAQISQVEKSPDVFIISNGVNARADALRLQQRLCASGFSTILNCGDAGIKNQFKKADRSKAKLALIIGEEESSNGEAGIKVLDRSVSPSEQQTVAQSDAVNAVTNWLESL